jgi:hypothetical protein
MGTVPRRESVSNSFLCHRELLKRHGPAVRGPKVRLTGVATNSGQLQASKNSNRQFQSTTGPA